MQQTIKELVVKLIEEVGKPDLLGANFFADVSDYNLKRGEHTVNIFNLKANDQTWEIIVREIVLMSWFVSERENRSFDIHFIGDEKKFKQWLTLLKLRNPEYFNKIN